MSKLPSGAANDQAKKVIDWERIETDYRAGVLSVREIAAAHGISHTYINARAKKFKWKRDLTEKIHAKADSIVSSAVVSTVVSTETAISDMAIVEANAKVIADVRIGHRTDINRFRNLAIKLLTELEITSDSVELFEQLGELLIDRSDEDEKIFQAKRVEALNRALSTSSRIDSAKRLAETLKVLITLEREAYGISETTKLDVNANVTNHFEPLATDWATFKAKVLEKARLH